MFQKLSDTLFGEGDQFLLEHRLFNIILLAGTLIPLISSIQNIFLNNHIFTIALPLIYTLVSLFLYYFSRFKHCYKIPSWIIITLLAFVITPLLWFFNGGSIGGFQYFILPYTMIFMVLINGKKRILFLIFYYFLYIILISIEFYHPDYIYGYKNQADRYSDVAFSMILSSFLSIILFIVYLNAYNNERKKIKEYTNKIEIERNKFKDKNKIIETELTLARNIQMQFIPSKSPEPYIEFYYQPMTMLGGDLIDFIHFRNSEKIGVFISDASGHGVPAALITSMIKSNLLEIGSKTKYPSDLLKTLNTNLINQTGGNFISSFYGLYYPQTREFTYSNAGHNSPFIISGKNIHTLDTVNRSLPLAILNNESLKNMNKEYKDNTIILEKNSKILFYTDGLIETVNIHKKMINEKTQDFEKQILLNIRRKLYKLPAKEFIKNLINELIDFRGSQDFDDDVCAICLDVF